MIQKREFNMKFQDVLGQQQLKNYLLQTVLNSRVSHAQLFFGPEGSGKLALAIAYAQFIFCKNKIIFEDKNELKADACGECPSCIKMKKLVHPDLHFFYPVASGKDIKSKRSIDFISKWREALIENNFYLSLQDWYDVISVENKQGTIYAEDCDEIVKKVSLKPFESEYKIVIIWHIEKLFHAAAPKLLKILEEPPDKTLFILISEKQEQIINTIVSRAQPVKVGKLPNQVINSRLVKTHDISEIQARRISTISEGNYIIAKKLIGEIDEESDDFEKIMQWFRYCYSKNKADVPALFSYIDDISKIGREKQKQFLNEALKIIRYGNFTAYSDKKLVKINEKELETVMKFSTVLNNLIVEKIAQELNKAFHHIERNANPKILFTDLSFKIHQILRENTRK